MVVRQQQFSSNQIRQVPGGVLGHDLHAKRVASLCDATLGVHGASLAVCTIGHGLAAARGLNSKHATKQVDRLLSNPNINVDDILARWVPYIVGARNSIVVALDWTDFDADKQATIMLSLITDHGRATPLVWLTVEKDTLKDHRSLYEHRVLVRLAELLPADIKVCVVADRGFGDQKLYRMLTEELCFDYVIRFRGNIAVTATTGETRTAAAWVRPGGRARMLRGAAVTADRYPVDRDLCSGSGHEAGLVPGRQQHRCDRQGPGRILRPSLGHRVRTARYQGSALRHGDGCDACQIPRAARSAMVDQRFRGGAADVARRRWRGAGL
jgi:hypothetical protein